MLEKEYRIPLPMSLEEYRIGQLYMIQKKSKAENSSSRVKIKILKNESYHDESKNEQGQYTHKTYILTEAIPQWLRTIARVDQITLDEHAWNCYPYTKTKYTCSFFKTFSLLLETKYLPDGGETENVFNLEPERLSKIDTVLVDIVKDKKQVGKIEKEEDPSTFVSKTKPERCPLNDNWLNEARENAIKNSKNMTNQEKATNVNLMCAYKLCTVDFSGIWGFQKKIEEFIFGYGILKTVLHGHLQAWAWQDEFHGLNIENIREMEQNTADLLDQDK